MITTLERILWFVAFIVITEVIFILWTKRIKKGNYNDFGIIDIGEDFILRKIGSSLFSSFIIVLNFILVWMDNNNIITENPRYINILYELLIIIGIRIFFYINKKINDKILK